MKKKYSINAEKETPVLGKGEEGENRLKKTERSGKCVGLPVGWTAWVGEKKKTHKRG